MRAFRQVDPVLAVEQALDKSFKLLLADERVCAEINGRRL
jgi:hypothetical protein